MKKCIICLEEKEATSFGEEHVIPETIGGNYIINNVCNSCNSNLGQKVDIKIINEFLPVCLRHEKDIRGKSGLLPIMFPGTFENEFDKKEKYRLEHDENGNIRPVLIYRGQFGYRKLLYVKLIFYHFWFFWKRNILDVKTVMRGH